MIWCTNSIGGQNLLWKRMRESKIKNPFLSRTKYILKFQNNKFQFVSCCDMMLPTLSYDMI
ncbi:hypothetical protein CN488_31185 [Bacillus anthracis]|nr:hypothetical protein CN488_31185 [Bacillus anthracis]